MLIKVKYLVLVPAMLANFIQGATGQSFTPRPSIVETFKSRATGVRELEKCNPPGLGTTECDDVSTHDKWQACADACAAASCCQVTCCEGCDCPSSCLTYTPCLGLGPPPTGTQPPSPSPDTCSILSVNYYEGFNLHFQVSRSQAESLMPYSWFSPLRINVMGDPPKPPPCNKDTRKDKHGFLQGDQGSSDQGSSSSNSNKSDFYISFYVATIGVNVGEMEVRVGRADLFTYAIDPKGEPTLVFLGAFLEVPISFQQEDALNALMEYKKTVQDSALDSRTGELAYPHYFAFDFMIDEGGFMIGGGDLEDAFIQIDVNEDCIGREASFSEEFVLANSLVYRSPVDKNVNYFNKDFIGAPVQIVPVNNRCLATLRIDPLLEMLPNQAALKSVQAYGTKDKAITWQYEDKTDASGTPYLTLAEKKEREDFKKQVFSDTSNQRAADIKAGTAESLLKLIQQEDVLFINWELSQEGKDELSETLNLGNLGLTMVPIQILKDETPRYFLSLNAYIVRFEGVPGQTATGVRFEFSIYVRTADSPRPYYMIIDALSDVGSYDPVNGPTEASNIAHSRVGNVLSVRMNSDYIWKADFELEDTIPLSVEKDWIIANDVVYWSNGVADELFFDKSFTLQLPIKAKLTSISGSNAYSHLLADPSVPLHAFVYEKSIDFIVRPWYNLNSVPLDNKAELQAVKSYVYGGLADLAAVNIANGQQEPLVDLLVFGEYPNTPRLALNFEIPQEMLPMMERAIGLPDEYHIVQMSMTAISKPKYMLTVAVFTEDLVYGGGAAFHKAAWTVYVKDEADGHTFLHEFHVETSSPGLDIEEILKSPAELFTVTTVDGILDVSIKNGKLEASFKVPMDTTTESRISLADTWVHSHNRVLWQKGVYDKLYYNGGLWNAKVIPVNSEQAVISQATPWSAFTSESPFEVLFFDADFVFFISSPWHNLN